MVKPTVRWIDRPAVGLAIYLIWAAGMVIVGWWVWALLVTALIAPFVVRSWLRTRKSVPMAGRSDDLPPVSHHEPFDS